jgi:hypothetical protein
MPTREVIEDDHADALFSECADDVRTDVSGASGDQPGHDASSIPGDDSRPYRA